MQALAELAIGEPLSADTFQCLHWLSPPFCRPLEPGGFFVSGFPPPDNDIIQRLLNIVKSISYIFLNIFCFLLAIINYILYNIIKEAIRLTIEQKLKMALAYSGISQAELARRIGTTPSNLNQKVKRNTLTNEELEQIALALGGSWRAEFVFADGTVI